MKVRLRFLVPRPVASCEGGDVSVLLQRSERASPDEQPQTCVRAADASEGALTAETLWGYPHHGRLSYCYGYQDRQSCRLERTVPVRWLVAVLGDNTEPHAAPRVPVYSFDDTIVRVRFALKVHTAFGRFVVVKCCKSVCVLQWSATDIWRGEMTIDSSEVLWGDDLAYQWADLPEAEAMTVTAADACWSRSTMQLLKLESNTAVRERPEEPCRSAPDDAIPEPPISLSLTPGVPVTPWPQYVKNVGDLRIERLYTSWLQLRIAPANNSNGEGDASLDSELHGLVSEEEWRALSRFGQRLSPTSAWSQEPMMTIPREKIDENTRLMDEPSFSIGQPPKASKKNQAAESPSGPQPHQQQRPRRWRLLLFCLLWSWAAVGALYAYRQNFAPTERFAGKRHSLKRQ
jgi:hypothetical protein